jgi:membrane protein
MLLSLLLSEAPVMAGRSRFFLVHFFTMKISKAGSAILLTVREFLEDSCQIRSASLAFSSLLALVPLTATVFSISAAFGAFTNVKEQIKTFLIQQLIPTRQEEIFSSLEGFVNNAGALGIVGFLVFAVTSISLLNGINMNCNAVWGSNVRKGFLSIFTTYTSIIVFGTLLIGASVTVTAAAGTIITSMINSPLLIQFLLWFSSPLMIFMLFMLTILLVPTGPVSPKSAALGALVGTLLWELIKFAFVRGTNFVIRSSVIYGSIATIPIFLVWLYIGWLIFFAAIETAYVHQHRETAFSLKKLNAFSEKAVLMLQLFFLTARSFIDGKGAVDTKALMLEQGIDQELFFELLHPCIDAGALYLDDPGEKIMLSRDPDSFTIQELLSILLPLQEKVGKPGCRDGEILFRKMSYAGKAVFEDMTVKEFLLSLNQDGDRREADA